MTVFLTTQYLEEADRLADWIAVLDGGRVIAEGTAAELKQRVAARRLDLTCVDPAAFAKVSAHLGDRATHRDAASLTAGLPTDGSAAEIRARLDEADPGRRAPAGHAGHRDHPRPAPHAGRDSGGCGAGLVRRPAGRLGRPVGVAVPPPYRLTH